MTASSPHTNPTAVGLSASASAEAYLLLGEQNPVDSAVNISIGKKLPMLHQKLQTIHVDTVDTSLLQIGLDYTYPIIQQNYLKWSFEQLSFFYEKPNFNCLSNSLGVIYRHSHYDKLRSDAGLKYKGEYRGSKINRILCSKFQCDRCRPLLKNALKNKMQLAITEHQLYTHFVITSEGKEYRDQNDYVQSYKDMAKSWNKIRRLLSYDAKKQGKHFSYICLFRSQRNGYCHLHVMTNCYISKQRLKDISKKYFNTGFISIKSNKDVTLYLTNDFLKDHEFFIPMGRRHYATSRNINLNIYEFDGDDDGGDDDDDSYHPAISIHIHLQRRVSVLDQVYTAIEHEYGYPPPFEFLLQQFTQVSQCEHSASIKKPISELPDLVNDLKKEYPDENVYINDDNVIIWK